MKAPQQQAFAGLEAPPVKAKPVSVFDDPNNLPGIMLDQPYAGAIKLVGLVGDGKDIETRTRRCNYRGDIVICATANVKPDVATVLRVGKMLKDRVPLAEYKHATWEHACTMAVAEIYDCRPLVAEDYERSLWWDAEENARKPRWAWCLRNVRPMMPSPISGHQGWMRVPRTVVEGWTLSADEIAIWRAELQYA